MVNNKWLVIKNTKQRYFYAIEIILQNLVEMLHLFINAILCSQYILSVNM